MSYGCMKWDTCLTLTNMHTEAQEHMHRGRTCTNTDLWREKQGVERPAVD